MSVLKEHEPAMAQMIAFAVNSVTARMFVADSNNASPVCRWEQAKTTTAGCDRCAPPVPRLHSLGQGGKLVEDWNEARVFEDKIQSRPSPLEFRVAFLPPGISSEQRLAVRLHASPATLAHRALAYLTHITRF